MPRPSSFFMQEMGLEPTRHCCHRHLKPARLPIPPLLRTKTTIQKYRAQVNKNFSDSAILQFLRIPDLYLEFLRIPGPYIEFLFSPLRLV